VVPAPATEQLAPAPQNSPPPAEIAGWIAELEDNHYLVREQATRRLLAAGATALDPLLEAANGPGPERADRAVWILRRYAAAKDSGLRRPALERLVQLRDRPRISTAALQALAVIRHQEAVATIEKLGGRFTSAQLGPNSTAPYTTGYVVIDNQWRGGEAGLAHLADLLGLRLVAIVGADISIAGVAELRKVEQLERLWLYGTKLESDDLPKVQALLPQVAIDFRRGGLLGIGANQFEAEIGQATVGNVQKGGVAEAAGIQMGDVIHKFNGQPVSSFKDLTTKIGQLRAGEEVKLDVLREGKPISFTIKLGQWETI